MVFMEGKIDNFLTLYYENPEKMVVNWDIYAPFLDVKQFVGVFTSASKKAPKTKSKKLILASHQLTFKTSRACPQHKY